MSIMMFPYPAQAKKAWDTWAVGREKLEKIVGERVVLVEGWGTSLAKYLEQKKHPRFVEDFYPHGADFYLITEAGAKDRTQPEQMGCLGHVVPGYDGFYPPGGIAWFNLTQFPSCCGLCLSYTTMVSSPWMKQGIGTLVMELKEHIARTAGYTAIMGTIQEQMVGEKKIWDKSGWKVVGSWKNRRTQNLVLTGQKIL